MKDFLKKMREAIDAGLTVKEFAQSIGKTTQQVYHMKHHYCKKGVKLPRFRHPDDWTESEILELKNHLNKNGDYNNLKIANKSHHAIRNKAARLGLIGDGVPRPKWEDSETKKLKRLVAKGLKRSVIAKKLKRTESSVQQKLKRLGMVKKSTCSRKIPEYLMETYENLLREYHTTMTPLDISSLWNDSYVFKTNARMVRYHLRKLNIKCSHQHTWNLKNEKKKRAEAEKET